MNYISKLKEKIDTVQSVSELTETMMWECHDTTIWRSDKFVGLPSFYPIYRWNNYYSYSVLALILKKGNLFVNREVTETKVELGVILDNLTIDKDIKRIGQAHNFDYSIKQKDDYCSQIVQALIEDTKYIEDINLGHTNIIMCGGKDSLNLLLLPWENPVVAISADPNYELVREFVANNCLNVKVIRLEDKYDETGLNNEILEACCRADLCHWRWGIHLKQIVAEYNHKTIIWKGQLGDVYMSPAWKTYLYPTKQPQNFFCKVYKKISPFLFDFLNEKIGKIIQPHVIRTSWDKSANLQGCHVGFIRALCDCLVLSAYHGAKVTSVFSKANLSSVAQEDIRSEVGELILGKKVVYPKENPGPKISSFRIDKNLPEIFIEQVAKAGIEIC